MKVYFLPRTTPGKWSGGLIISFFIFLGIFYLSCALGQRGGATYFSNLALAIPITVAGVCGIAALIIGLIGIVRSRERSVSVFLSVIIGFLVFLYCLGEFIYPH